MSKVKEILILLIVIYVVMLVSGFVVGSVTNIVFPPSEANYGDKVVEDIGGDGILTATLNSYAKVGEKHISDDYFDTELITNLSWHDAKNISFVDTSGKKGYMIVWKTSPDEYSVLDTNGTSYISDYLAENKGTCFMEYAPKTKQVYGIIISSEDIAFSESSLLYKILDLDRSEFIKTYSTSSATGSYGYSGGYGHYGGVDTSPRAIASTSPDWFYEYYDYGDYDDIDEYLESDGYD